MCGAIPPLLQYAFIVWCSVKAQGQLYVYLLSYSLSLLFSSFLHLYSPSLNIFLLNSSQYLLHYFHSTFFLAVLSFPTPYIQFYSSSP